MTGPLVGAIGPEGRNRHLLQVHSHSANGRVRPLNQERIVEANDIVHVQQPHCLPDSAESDFWWFGDINRSLQDKYFTKSEKLLDPGNLFLCPVSPNNLSDVGEAWIARVTWVLEHEGVYYPFRSGLRIS